MAGDFFKLIGDFAEAAGIGEDVVRGFTGGLDAYEKGRSTQTDVDRPDGPYVYERWLTRPRDPSINDR